MADINEIKFSGTIERLQSITTRTGKQMATWLLKVARDRFKCVCFGNLADAVLQCNDGDQISYQKADTGSQVTQQPDPHDLSEYDTIPDTPF